MIDRCIHGIEKGNCAFCNPLIHVAQKRKERTSKKDIHSQYQIASTTTANRHKLPIEDWELETFINKIAGIDDDQKLFDLSVKLERTFDAMKWWYVVCFKSETCTKGKCEDIVKRFADMKDKIGYIEGAFV
jgi:hypothetical protein